MKRKLFNIVLLVVLCFPLAAQTKIADSLLKYIDNAPPDTNKVNAMNMYAYEFRSSDPKMAIEYAQKTLALANKLSFKKGIGVAEYIIGTCLYNRSEHSEAIVHLNTALPIFIDLNDIKNLGRTYNSLGNVYKGFNNFEESKKKYHLAIKYSGESGNEDGKATSLSNLGSIYVAEANYPEAMKYLEEALAIRNRLGNKLQLADSYFFIALVQSSQGSYPPALKNLFKALAIREEFKDNIGAGDVYANIGIIYMKMGNNAEAKKFQRKALALATGVDDQLGIGNATFNLGTACLYVQQLDSAIYYYDLSLNVKEKISDRGGMAGCYANIAEINRLKKDYPAAIKSAETALACYDGLKLAEGSAITSFTLSTIYMNMGKYDKSKEFIERGLQLAINIKSNEILRDAYLYYTQLDSASGNFAKAFEHQKKYMIYRDSVSNQENTRRIVQTQMEYEFDKREAIAKSEQEKKDELAAIEQRKQKWVRNAFVGGFLLMLIAAGLAYRNYKRKQKDNEIISQQKEQVEEKNREITQSIEYALRIQTAILPPSKLVKLYLQKSFILYLPKDIVAGDFYWMEVIGDKILFAACDCTGHGVPGAMVSVICHNALNRSVREFGLTNPASILDKTAEIVIENFALSENEIKDGMDISLCVLDKKTNELRWAGANNPLWLLRKGELIETKADKQPIGVSDHKKPFTEHSFWLEKGDRIYVFTDGFADQFGGEKEKKLTRKGFKDLLHSLEFMELDNQGSVMGNFIADYRQKLEQIDDILVIGVEIQG